jgi:hypothetical protein
MRGHFIRVTGTEYIVYALWGEEPEYPDYMTYGFATESEQYAFLYGVEEASGWNCSVIFRGHGTDNNVLAEFKQAVRREHPSLFEKDGGSNV